MPTFEKSTFPVTDIEWFRQTDWTPSASAEFERRLARARGQRSEYLRIQALALAATEMQEFAEAAIGLARRFLALKQAGSGVAQAHATIARAHATLGEIEAAVAAYGLAVDAEYAQPNIRGYHYLDFAWFVATQAVDTQYDEVLRVIQRNKRDQDLMFPANQYRYFGALALISAAQGDEENARRMAEGALSAAAHERGPFENHPGLGLVARDKSKSHARLQRLAIV